MEMLFSALVAQRRLFGIAFPLRRHLRKCCYYSKHLFSAFTEILLILHKYQTVLEKFSNNEKIKIQPNIKLQTETITGIFADDDAAADDYVDDAAAAVVLFNCFPFLLSVFKYIFNISLIDLILDSWDPYLISFTPEQLNELPFGNFIQYLYGMLIIQKSSSSHCHSNVFGRLYLLSDLLISISSQRLHFGDYGSQSGTMSCKFLLNLFERLDDWPESFKAFIHEALRFSSLRQQCVTKSLQDVTIDAELKRGMSAKKQHEVSNMAPLVHQLMEQTGSDMVVDIGSGLGYLGQTLHNKYGHTVIGLESKQSHTSRAEKRHFKTDSMNGVFNLTFELQQDGLCMQKFEHMILEFYDKITTSKDQNVQKDRNISEDQNVTKDQDVAKDQDTQIPCPLQQIDSCSDVNSKHFIDNNVAMVTESSGVNKFKQQSFKNNETSCGHTNLEQDINVTESKFNIEVSNCSSKYVIDDDNQCQQCVDSISVNSPRLPRVLMIGLHCCGDLTPTMMDYFLKLDIVKGLCCVSCCYHRMNFDGTNICNAVFKIQCHFLYMYKEFKKKKKKKNFTKIKNSRNFQNFPLSSKMKQAYREVRKTHSDWLLNVYSMRLAAQETRSRWKNQSQNDHIKHIYSVAYRGILELFINEDSGSTKKLFRKVVHKSDFSSFHDYIEAVCSRTTLADTEYNNKPKLEISTRAHLNQYTGHTADKDNISSIKQRLLELHEENQKWFRYIEPITPVLEGMILIDRLLWLQENKCHGELFPVFNDHISPRNIALISYNVSKNRCYLLQQDCKKKKLWASFMYQEIPTNICAELFFTNCATMLINELVLISARSNRILQYAYGIIEKKRIPKRRQLKIYKYIILTLNQKNSKEQITQNLPIVSCNILLTYINSKQSGLHSQNKILVHNFLLTLDRNIS
ncbi:hypothetical protein KUTeg_015754 [Tegillarca granosa]|uniref:Methyltransferase domain-containing protein n=1 Tax=Tegillarca granosa TaxID=220873 RepID=A0ABQ9EN95_TEGGR|nr:hypothetical protein KUTeg_015754 [Tegillarca granosa]